MTSPDCQRHRSRGGSCQAADRRRYLVNVQGDEPEMRAERSIGRSRCWKTTPHMVMSTLATPIRSERSWRIRPASKWCSTAAGKALYSAAARSRTPASGARNCSGRSAAILSAHRTVRLPPRISAAAGRPSPYAAGKTRKPGTTPRAGTRLSIAVGVVDEPTVGIDTPEDYRAFVRRALARLRCTSRDAVALALPRTPEVPIGSRFPSVHSADSAVSRSALARQRS